MPAKGYHFHHTEEAKKKISKALVGHPVSAETRRKISEKNKGRHFSPATQFKVGHKHSPEVRRKISEVQKGRKLPEETKRKMSKSHKLNPYWKERKFSDEHRQHLSEAHKGHKRSRASRRKQAKSMSKRWTDPTFRKKTVKAVMSAEHVRPTKPEQKLIDIINKHGFPFKYVGDGEVVIHGKCPDFINNNGEKELIELYGDYWHRNDDPQERISLFKQYGFDTLIIWEHELTNENVVVDRINEFMVWCKWL